MWAEEATIYGDLHLFNNKYRIFYFILFSSVFEYMEELDCNDLKFKIVLT